MMDILFMLAMLATVLEASVKTIERVTKLVKKIISRSMCQSDVNKLLVIFGGVLLAVKTNLCVLDTIAKPILGADFSFGILGVILVGLVIGRGSNVIHNMIKRIQLKDTEE